ncbi:hypothetical protein [Gilvibacter sp.]|uniref:hypothetical protein n=1 Tax=Gilvibacter sp. TaxID=2729997 RepID=UPI003F49C3DD
MIKDKLDYSVSLRMQGLGSSEIRAKMEQEGFSEAQIEYYLKKSDEVFLSESINYRRNRAKRGPKRGLKTFALFTSLGMLLLVFYGYYGIGLLGLFFCWTLVRYSSFNR